MKNTIYEYLIEHLNVWWLRPESALWDTVASYEINQLDIKEVDIDLGSGNGIYSFITAGGRFSEKFDWFKQADISDPQKNVFDYFAPDRFKNEFITKMPDIPYRVAFDKKRIMLNQAKTLNWYETYIEGDIEKLSSFEDNSSATIFSNILYWIPDPKPAMIEIRRILKKNGHIILCLPDLRFIDFCPSYKAYQKEFRWLYRLNRDRIKCIAKYYSFSDIKELAQNYNFKIVYNKQYLSKELLSFWDIGLRPIIRPLLKMVSYLTERERLEVKKEWVEQLKEDLFPVVEREITTDAPKGFHFIVLEKI